VKDSLRREFSEFGLVAQASQAPEKVPQRVIPSLRAAGRRSEESLCGLNSRKEGFLGTQRASE
jgi:hypothetical protein